MKNQNNNKSNNDTPKINNVPKEDPSVERKIEKPFKEYAITPPVVKPEEDNYKPLKRRPYIPNIPNQNMDYIHKDIEIEDNFRIIMELIKDLEEKVSKL